MQTDQEYTYVYKTLSQRMFTQLSKSQLKELIQLHTKEPISPKNNEDMSERKAFLWYVLELLS